MHILLDMQSCQSASRFRGIGRYSVSLTKAIINKSPHHKISILLNSIYPVDIINTVRDEFKDLLPPEEIYVFSAQGPTAYHDSANHGRHRAAIICRELAIDNIRPDVVCIMSTTEGFYDDFIISIPKDNNKIKTFAIVYDLIPLLNKKVYLADPALESFYLNTLQDLEYADGLLAISASAENEFKLNTNIAHEKIVNISSATDEHFKIIDISPKQKDTLLSKYGIKDNFIMTIGILERRKNIESLIQAYSLIPKKIRVIHQLVLACQIKPHDKERLVAIAIKYGLEESDIAFTGFIPDADLVALYNLCKLFVFPSLHEGFGLPPLEAMCCGAATIASNTTSLPEVMGWSQAMFDPSNVEDMAAVIEKSLSDENFRQELIMNAEKQSRLFSWEKCAEKTIAAFEQIFSKNCEQELGPSNRLENAINNIRHIPATSLNNVDRLGVSWAMARNSFSSHQKKILIDISELVRHDARTGIQRVVRSVLSNLIEDGCDGYSIRAVYCEHGRLFHYANRYLNDNYGLDYGNDEPVLFTKDDIFLGLDLTAHLFPYLNPQLDSIRRAGAQVYYVVYDLIPLLYPDWTHAGVRAAFPLWIKSLAENSDGLICISNSVAEELKFYLEENKKDISSNPYLKIKYFHLGADLQASRPSIGKPSNASIILENIKSRPTFLMVSTIEPRKGHTDVLNAFDKLWEAGNDSNLVIVGKKGWDVEALADKMTSHGELNHRLFWLSDIGDDFLEEIYSLAEALIVASFAEGFGLPVIEAAQQGLPVIARDIPVFREIAGDYAYYFEGDDPESIKNTIMNWLEAKNNNCVPDSKNINWLTWKESTNQLLEQLPLSKLS